MSRTRREAIRGHERSSWARRRRQLANLRTLAGLSSASFPVSRKLMATYRELIRRHMGRGWIYWAPLGSEPERIESIRSWQSLGWTDEGSSESWTPGETDWTGWRSMGYIVVEDELEAFRDHLPGSAEKTHALRTILQARKIGSCEG